MSLETLERNLVKSCNFEFGTKYKIDELMEWSSSPINMRPDEIYHRLKNGMYLAFKNHI